LTGPRVRLRVFSARGSDFYFKAPAHAPKKPTRGRQRQGEARRARTRVTALARDRERGSLGRINPKPP